MVREICESPLSDSEHIGHPSAPACARNLIRDRGLPLHRLVGMREELRRNGGPAGEILGAGDGRDERAHIRDDPEVALVKEGLQFHEVRMETEVAAVAILQSERKKRRLRDGESASRGGVGGVSARVARHDDVVGIVSTEKEQADERLVVAAVGMVAALSRRRSKMVLSSPVVVSAAQAAWRMKVRRVGAYITICRW